MALARWQRTIVNAAGDVQPLASIEVRLEIPGQPLVALFSDRDGATLLGNPFLAGPSGGVSAGFAAFHVAGGAYKITATLGAFSQTWRYVPIGTASEFDVNLDGSVLEISSFYPQEVEVLIADRDQYDVGPVFDGLGRRLSVLIIQDATNLDEESNPLPTVYFLKSIGPAVWTPGFTFNLQVTETVRFDFEGDGATVAFDIGAVIQNPKHVFWYEDGFRQRETDEFTTSGSVVTRTSPPLDGAVIWGQMFVFSDIAGLGTTLDQKLNRAGGTMTGPLGLAGNSANPLEAVPKQQLDAAVAAEAAARAAAITAAVVGLFDDRGNYDASVNTFPAAGGSGAAGSILKGDIWLISVAGTLGGAAVAIGDTVRALIDAPGQTAANWAVGEANIVGAVTLNAVQTLTNKTLTAPVINSPTGITKTDVGLPNVLNATQLVAADIGVAVQAYSVKTAAIAAATWAVDQFFYFTSATAGAVTGLTSVARTLLAQTTQALMRTAGLGASAVGDAVFIAADQATARSAIGAGVGTGDVVGPASATGNAFARFNSTTGKLIKDSVVTSDDSGYTKIGTATPFIAGTGLDVLAPNLALANGPGTVNVYSTDNIAIDKGGSLGLGGKGGNNPFPFALIAGRSENDAYAGYLQLSVVNSASSIVEAARFNSGGKFGIGLTTNVTYLLQVNTDSAAKPGIGGLWTVPSDTRLKENIVDANLERCWEIVKGLPLKRFTFPEDIYTKEQVPDRSALGWIADDVKPYFPRSVSKHTFSKVAVPDGEEEFEEQAVSVDPVDCEEVDLKVRDGKMVKTTKIVKKSKVPLFDIYPLVDADGTPIKDHEGHEILHRVPRMVKKMRPKFKQEVIKDCLDFNAGQVIASLYGTVQLLIKKVEKLEGSKK